METKAFYNEHDPFAAAWLRELIKQGLIAPGVVDERSIEDITPNELTEYTQCHFFAGIGGWSYALRLAGWPDDEPVWTGSCPCQPFSAAGKRTGSADERHLWPAFYHLISECKPNAIFGEQVEAAIRQGWLDLVQADLEGINYRFGAAGLPAAGFGAPHIRQRLFFVADLHRGRRVQFDPGFGGLSEFNKNIETSDLVVGNSECERGLDGRRLHWGHTSKSERGEETVGGELRNKTEGTSAAYELGNANCEPGEWNSGSLFGTQTTVNSEGEPNGGSHIGYSSDGPTSGFWGEADWIYCRDQKYRPVEPGTFPLAHGSPARVGRLRGYGNAIVPQVAEAFVKSYMDSKITETYP
jgi:DNA (cytosine-5)-methyltransferase 1